LAFSLNIIFLYLILLLFLLSQIYTLWLKKEVIADVLLISINFVIRSLAGAFVIINQNKPYIWISPWLLLCPFFLALFLSIGKRHADLKFLGKKASKHNTTLNTYSLEITKPLMIISTTLLIICYSLYTILSINQLLITMPFAIYAVFRYSYLVQQGSIIGRQPQKAFTDIRLVIASIMWIATVLSIIHLL